MIISIVEFLRDMQEETEHNRYHVRGISSTAEQIFYMDKTRVRLLHPLLRRGSSIGRAAIYLYILSKYLLQFYDLKSVCCWFNPNPRHISR